MIRVRAWALGLGMALVLASVAVAGADNKAKGKGKGKGGIAAALDRLAQLLPPGAGDKLKLSEDQTKQVNKIQDEYADKSKDVLAGLKDAFTQNRDAIRKARKDKDKAALKQAMAPIRDKGKELAAIRSDYEAKVRDVLNDDQKKTLDELTAAERGKGPLASLLGKGKKKKPGGP
jgi:Zn-dependent M32 family carboxypeptidase